MQQMLNILYLYNATQTYTNAVFEHLEALGKFSRNRAFFMHSAPDRLFDVDLSRFDAVCVHFSIRLPFDQLSRSTVEALTNFNGLKFLFIQDEYDYTYRTWYWINTLGFQLVFTVVPERGISQVYPPEQFPNTRFQTNLTGYVPSELLAGEPVTPPSQRSLIVGYRGRPLPPRYGALGFEKVEIGKMVHAYCQKHGIPSDIAWTEEARIYGPDWYSFLRSCRSMLGSESGSNVFNWDGLLESKVAEYRKHNPRASDSELYRDVISPNELDGIMNQVSPRIFEAIAARTVLVLFEGEYSGVVRPHEHFIPLKKDGSNLQETFTKLNDVNYVDDMAERAYRDVIDSGLYGYPKFLDMVDNKIEMSFKILSLGTRNEHTRRSVAGTLTGSFAQITTTPIRAIVSRASPSLQWDGDLKIVIPVTRVWARIPEPLRVCMRPAVRFLKNMVFAKER